MPSSQAQIMVADDDLDHCRLIKRAFRHARFQGQLSFVHDGQALIDRLNSSTELPDAVILDLNMPVKDGFTTLAELQADRHLSQVPVVVLTGQHDEQAFMKAYKLGATFFLSKPDNFRELVNTIRSLDKYWQDVLNQVSRPQRLNLQARPDAMSA